MPVRQTQAPVSQRADSPARRTSTRNFRKAHVDVRRTSKTHKLDRGTPALPAG